MSEKSTEYFHFVPFEEVFRDRKEQKEAYIEVYVKNPLGRRVLQDLLFAAGMHKTAFHNASDGQTYYNLGKQFIGYHILNLLHGELQRVKLNDRPNHLILPSGSDSDSKYDAAPSDDIGGSNRL